MRRDDPAPLLPWDAQARWLAEIAPLAPAALPLRACRGLHLAEAVHSPADRPARDQSAVDGYGVGVEHLDLLTGVTAAVGAEGTVARAAERPRATGGVLRLNTGAAVPPEVAAVVPIEDTRTGAGADEIVLPAGVRAGANIRRQAEELRAGDQLLGPGASLGPVELGLLAGLGFSTLPVRPPPRVAVLITGDEFTDGPAGDANGPLLAAAVQALGGAPLGPVAVGDDADSFARLLRSALAEADLVISTGGASVGPHDHLGAAWAAAGVRPLFTRLRMKPAKPTHAGVGRAPDGRAVPVLGLPGNPLAVWTSFELLGAPAIERMMGRASQAHGRWMPLAAPVRLGPRPQLLRGHAVGPAHAPCLLPVPQQNSGMLLPATGGALCALIPGGEGTLAEGAPVWVDQRAGGSWPPG